MVFYKPISKEQARKLAEEIKFFSTHNHTEVSNFRLRDCIIKIPDLINRSIELRYSGVCCTDHEALSAHVRFIKRYKEIKENKEKYEKLKEGKTPEELEEELNKNENKSIKKELKYFDNFNNFKIGLGNEIYLVDRPEEEEKIGKFFHFILIAKDKKGYEQLKRISSDSAWKNWFRSGIMERVPTYKDELEAILEDEKGHIIAQSSCLRSELDNLILQYLETNDIVYKKQIDSFIKWCIKVFGIENFYLEIQPCVIKQDKDGNNIPHEQAKVNQFMFTLSKAYGLKVVCSTDSHYLVKEDAKIHESYLKADDNEKSRNREVAAFYETTYLFAVDELIETLSYHLTEEQIKEALINTQDIYNKIELFDLYHPTIVPTDKKIPEFKVKHIFKDWYDKYEYIKKYAESDDKQDQYLLYLVEQGFEKKKQWGDSSYHFATYDENGEIIEEHDKVVTQEEKIARINEEFSSFWQISERLNQKLSAYYVLVRGLVHEVMWKVSFVGVARGSAGGSYICYLSEITQINPLKYDLPFWRHSSPLRPELPD